MNLTAVASLPLHPETGTWYRCVGPQFQLAALSARHTMSVRSRYSAGPAASTPFQTLYFAEDSIVGAFEFGALFGSPASPLSNPKVNFMLLCVNVRLLRVVDITQTSLQQTLGTTAQEITGDWKSYNTRQPLDSVPGPVGIAPTQQLGEAIRNDPRRIEGFVTLSAKIPSRRILVIFPENLSPESDAAYSIAEAGGSRVLSQTIKF